MARILQRYIGAMIHGGQFAVREGGCGGFLYSASGLMGTGFGIKMMVAANEAPTQPSDMSGFSTVRGDDRSGLARCSDW